MAGPGVGDRLAIARLVGGSALSRAAARAVALPVIGQRLVRPRGGDFLFVPPDMWPHDPSLVDEMAAGQLGLEGTVLELGGASPFAVVPPNTAWARGLNGFAWLGSLRGAGDRHALEIARRLVADWCRRQRGRAGGSGVAGEPQVIARRLISWLAAGGFLLEDADATFYRLFMRALDGEVAALDQALWRAEPGYPRLLVLMALVLECLVRSGHERDLKGVEGRLLAELGRQILADGGHVTRNADVVLDILLDLLPIRQCYAARELVPPQELVTSLQRMQRHLRHVSIRAGTLARFNGVGAARVDAVATVLAVEAPANRATPATVAASGYARLERGETTVVVDCGRPPPLIHAGRAHAGCLSFELGHGGTALLVNGGAPHAAHRRTAPDARATASHSTLTLDDCSSSRLVRSEALERLAGGPAIVGPRRVTAMLSESDEGLELLASHDGYLAQYGLLHERRLLLARDGRRLDGADILRPPSGTLRLKRDLPLAVHFHFALGVQIAGDGNGGVAIEPPGRQAWRLTAQGSRFSVELGVDFATSRGPSTTRKAVLRATTPGESRLEWRLEQV